MLTRSKLEGANVVSEYLEGASTYELGEKYKVAANTISYFLKKKGISLRSSSDYTDKLNTYHFDDKWLDNLDCQEKFYFLGFFAADECNYTRRNLFSISVQEQDKYLLEQFLILLRSEKGLEYKPPCKTSVGNSGPQYYFRLSSRHFCDRLNELGLTPRKTMTLQFPNYCSIDNFRHFLRGLIDGDGSITIHQHEKSGNYQCHIDIYCGEHIIKGIQKFLKKELDVDSNIYDRKTYYALSICKQVSVVKLLKWIYDGSSIHLARKFEKAQIFLKNKETSPCTNSMQRERLIKVEQDIIKDYNDGMTVKQLVEKYKFSKSTIFRCTHRTHRKC